MKVRLVDSCGWLEYFMGGPNSGFFEPALKSHGTLLVPTICLAEVFKVIYRQHGRKVAGEYIVTMKQNQVVELDSVLAIEAGSLSVQHQLPIADAIILATARHHQAELWTQDRHFQKFTDVKYIPNP